MTIEASRRKSLPQLAGTGLFVTDGGLETELIFHDGLDLPCFAAFPLLENPDTRVRLRRYYDGYLAIAREHGAGFIVETPRGAPIPTGPVSSATRPSSSTQPTVIRCHSPKRCAWSRRPMGSPRW